MFFKKKYPFNHSGENPPEALDVYNGPTFEEPEEPEEPEEKTGETCEEKSGATE